MAEQRQRRIVLTQKLIRAKKDRMLWRTIIAHVLNGHATKKKNNKTEKVITNSRAHF